MKISKKAIILGTLLVVMMLLTACVSNNAEEKLDDNSEMKGVNSLENQDLKVLLAYTYDSKDYIMVENTSDEIILDYELSYMEFDKNGLKVGNYETKSVEAANLIPGDIEQGSWLGSNGKYVVVVVNHIVYKDGEEWNAEGIDEYFNSIENTFDVEEYNKYLTNLLKEEGPLAENNEYVKIKEASIKHNNQFSDDHDLYFIVENTSDKAIVYLQVWVVQFDKNGLPVSTSPYDDFSRNSRVAGSAVNIPSGENSDFTSPLFLSAGCDNIKCIVSYLEFKDGEEWTNPYIFKWICLNNGEFELE